MKNAQEVEKFMTKLDRLAEDSDTGDPDDEDENEDAGDPDADDQEAGDPDEDGEDDTAGPGNAAIRKILLHFQSANGGKPPNNDQLLGLLSHTFKKGVKVRKPPPPANARRPLLPNIYRFKNKLFRQVRKQHGGKTVTSKGYYYGTSEAVFTGVGDGLGAALVLEPGTISFFHEAIEDKVFRLADANGANGIAHTVNAGETNLQYPGKNLYPREVFIITHLGIEFCGMRVLYNPAELANLQLDSKIKDTLTGNGTLWDDGAVFLPGELLNDFDGRCRLIDAMFPTGVLYFVWDKKQAGGNRDRQELLISPLQKIPVTRMSLGETSGGVGLAEMSEGYVWSLDQQTSAGRAGIFEALIRTHEQVTFPIKPVDIAGSMLVPKRLSVILRMTVYGDAIRPKDDLVMTQDQRMRR
ncbi:MAG: hypothetical protein HUU26_03420 [Gemmatimonadaceae bacterium]|nr:hypothetical protein [Gemmatimonadaceae bacterium]